MAILDAQIERERLKTMEFATYIRALPITNMYKVIFFDLFTKRGIQREGAYEALVNSKQKMINIEENHTDTIEFFLLKKKTGFDRLHQMSVMFTEFQQKLYGDIVTRVGVKHYDARRYWTTVVEIWTIRNRVSANNWEEEFGKGII